MSNDLQSIRRSLLLLVASTSVAFAAGCYSLGDHCCVDRCADIPPGAIPPNAGTYNCRWQREEMARAHQDAFVIYQNEWYLGRDRLGPDGWKHLKTMSSHLAEAPNLVVLSPAESEELNTKRRKFVVDALLQLGVFDAPQRVVLGYPEAEGMYGAEAARYGNARLQGTATTGGAGAGSGTAGGIVGFGGTTTGLGSGGGVGVGGMGIY